MTSGNGIDAEPPSDCAAAASNLEPNNSATSSDGIVDGTSPDRAASPNRGPHEKRTSVKETHPSSPFPLPLPQLLMHSKMPAPLKLPIAVFRSFLFQGLCSLFDSPYNKEAENFVAFY